jgi:thymidylate synthase (FAD)
MKIVKPSVELLHCTPNPERVIERCGRACYQSQHKVAKCLHCVQGRLACTDGRPSFEPCEECDGTGTSITSAIAFIKMIRENGHESVLEHASAGFSIITDRGVTHELVRHRIASFSQESTRYCNYSQDRFERCIAVICPPELETAQADPEGLPYRNYADWNMAMAESETRYLRLLDRGVAPQIARSVLPNSLKSEICMTANFREWRHFLHLRTSPKAHPQMRQVAEMIRAELLRISPVCFEDIA